MLFLCAVRICSEQFLAVECEYISDDFRKLQYPLKKEGSKLYTRDNSENISKYIIVPYL